MRGEIAETRREQIIAAARSLYEERGIDRTSVKDIAERANITRSLFYHYFSSRDEVTDAILDAYVETFVAAVREWNAQRVRGDVDGALKTCVAMLRRHLFEEFFLLIIGLMSYMRTHPDASDELVADLIADTLHLDLGSQQD